MKDTGRTVSRRSGGRGGGRGAPAGSPASIPITRRQFFAKLGLAAGGIAAALVGIPVLGFIVAPVLERQPELWQSVGSVEKFKEGQTVEVSFADASPLPWAGVAARTAAWLRREPGDKFTAFAVNCTHLGCPVRWLPDAEIFMCPCHGGVYYADGNVAAGPPPRALSTYPVRVNNGQVEIQTKPIPIG
jgi:menaquinol-cytochrome c reductase iron-sulfur subunit